MIIGGHYLNPRFLSIPLLREKVLQLKGWKLGKKTNVQGIAESTFVFIKVKVCGCSQVGRWINYFIDVLLTIVQACTRAMNGENRQLVTD
jgi:hypothetical protein